MKKEIKKRGEGERMPFSRKNYIAIAVGVAVIVLGFLLMSGGGSDDPNVFNYSMFSWRRITLAPIMVLLGFGIEIFAIMHRFGRKEK